MNNLITPELLTSAISGIRLFAIVLLVLGLAKLVLLYAILTASKSRARNHYDKDGRLLMQEISLGSNPDEVSKFKNFAETLRSIGKN